MSNLFTAGLKTGGSSWHEFDSFPRPIRDALNYATIKYSTNSVARMLRKYPVSVVLERLAEQERVVAVNLAEIREADDFLHGLGL